MQKMRHEHIVELFEVIETEKYVFLIMEYVNGGSLHTYTIQEANNQPKRRLKEDEARRIYKQILVALDYCHQRYISH